MFRLITVLLHLSYIITVFGTGWNDLKVTWGMDPFNPNYFVSLPLSEAAAVQAGWIKENDCSKINGIRYFKNNDRSVMSVYGADGLIAGISSAIPKNLPFNFPSKALQPYLVDEGNFYTMTMYFKNPNTVCQAAIRQNTGDRLVVKGQSGEMNIPLTEIEVNIENKWTKGYCFNTMGLHYWRQVNGSQITVDMNKDNFFPMFLLYNKGKLNGFGFAFNANLDSPRLEHPTVDIINLFMKPTPSFFADKTQSEVLSTLHVFLDSTPFQNFC
jgi:hypothetical protein